MGDQRNAHNILVEIQGKRWFDRSRWRWKDNSKIGPKEIRCELYWHIIVNDLVYVIFWAFPMIFYRISRFWLLRDVEWCFLSVNVFSLQSADWCAHIPEHLDFFHLYRVSQEEWTKLRESVSYVKIYRYNPKHLCPKLNGYGDNGHRKVWASGVSTYWTPSVRPYSSTAHARQRDTIS